MGGIPPNYIICSISTMVEQQQRLFDLLWQKAIPAKQRLKEIEEGLKREFLETIQDPHEIKNLIPKVISSANEEILLLFSTVNTFKRYYAEGFLDLLVDKIRDRKNSELKVRILINSEIESTQLKETVSNISSGLNNLEVLQSKSTKYDTKVTFILVDREVSLVIEIKDDTKDRILDSVGFATYSNSQSSVLSYTSIFETLWIKAELSQRPTS
jgi:two-component system, OmpR family, sensor histidine kinase VicK